ncbi:SlyX family protein [Pseudorhodobacter aquimaris]|uniref:SlyX family protein n=1 Tax=Pseudorhodobacter aquimaris TaxID=687412 RepID=UPI0009FA25F0|nr:SlyX family protein [Pseudorhodobacter aquimaris]
MPEQNDDRINAMEERMAHLIRTVDELSDIVAKQANEIDRLTRRMAMMAERMEAPDEGGAVFTDQRPPHW